MKAVKILISRVVGAFRSGKRAAYVAMFIMAVSPFTSMIDRLLSKILMRIPDDYSAPPSLMIVASSRSGATIVNQVLTRELDCVYISNMHLLFPNFGSRIINSLSKWGRGDMTHKNYYGYTASLFDVNEANAFIDQITSEDLSKEQRAEMFRIFSYRMGASVDHPLVFKNVRHFEKLSLLVESIPNLSFAHVYRAPEFAVQSVLRAYYELKYFHPIPKSLENDMSEPIEFSVKQVFEVNRIIHEQIKAAGANRFLNIKYEDFCDSPSRFIDSLTEKFSIKKRNHKDTTSKYKLVPSVSIRIEQGEFDQISTLVKDSIQKSTTDLY